MKKLNSCSALRTQIKSTALALCLIGTVAMPQTAMAANTYKVVAVLDASDAGTNGFINGTIPLPKKYMLDDSIDRFGVEDVDGLKKLQADTVSRDADGSVAIVEVSGNVTGKSSPGEPQGLFRIVELPAELQTPKKKQIDTDTLATLEPEIRNFLAQKNLSLIAESQNQKYYCSLLNVGESNIKIHTVGAHKNTVRIFCDLKPVKGYSPAQQDTIPQVLSAMVFMKLVKGSKVLTIDVMLGNVRVTNGAYVGPTYVKNIWLAVPSGYMVVNDVPTPTYKPEPMTGGGFNIYRLAEARADGADYVMPALNWLSPRRLAITTPNNAAEATAVLRLQGLGFAKKAVYNGVETFNWQNPLTARFASGEALPSLTAFVSDATVKSKWNTLWNTFKNNLQVGAVAFPFDHGALGLHYLPGSPYGGATSGAGIDPVPAASGILAGSVNSVRWFQYQTGANFERDIGRLGVLENGEPWSLESTPGTLVSCTAGGNLTGLAQKAQFSTGDGKPINLSQDDPYGINGAGIYAYHSIKAQHPAYESTLLKFQPIDFQHLIRLFSGLGFLTDVTNDPAAKYLTRALAENVRAARTFYARNASNCPAMNSTPLVAQKQVDAYPGIGAPVGRDDADSLQAQIEAYTIGDDAYRNKTRYWINNMADIFTKAQTCIGAIMSKSLPLGKGLKDYNITDAYISQYIEDARISYMLTSLQQAFDGVDYVRSYNAKMVQKRYIEGLINPAYLMENGTALPQKRLVYLGKPGQGQLICPNNILPNMLEGGSNSLEQVTDLMRGHELTGDMAYLTLLKSVMKSPTIMEGFKKKFTTSVGQTYYWDSYAASGLKKAQDANIVY